MTIEEKLREIPIPPPSHSMKTKRLLELVDNLVSGTVESVVDSERELAGLTELRR